MKILSIAFGPPTEPEELKRILDKAIVDAKSGDSRCWDEYRKIYADLVSTQTSSEGSARRMFSALYGEFAHWHASVGEFHSEDVIYPALNIDLERTILDSGETLGSRIAAGDDEVLREIGIILSSSFKAKWCHVSTWSGRNPG